MPRSMTTFLSVERREYIHYINITTQGTGQISNTRNIIIASIRASSAQLFYPVFFTFSNGKVYSNWDY